MNDVRKIFVLSGIIFLLSFDLAGQDKNINLQILMSEANNEFKMPGYKKSFPDSLLLLEELNSLLYSIQDEAYLTAGFDSIKYSGDNVTAWLNPGHKYYWTNISVDKIDKSVLKKAGINERRFANEAVYYKKYLKTIGKITSWYENNAYPFASVQLENVKIENEKIKANLVVKENNRIVFDSLNIEGEAKISKKFINRYTGIFPGGPYSEKLVFDLSKRLNELAFLQEHRPFELEFTRDKAKMYLYLDKKKANRFNGILALYQRDSYSGKLGLKGELSFLLHNSFGIGEKVFFNWKKLESTSQKLETEFKYPFVISLPVGVNVGFGLFKKDSLYLNTNSHFGLEYFFSGENSYHIFFRNRVSSILSSPGIEVVNEGNIRGFNTKIYGMGLNYENLDYRFNPRKGVLLKIDVGAGNKKQPDNTTQESDQNEKYFEFVSDISYYVPIAQKIALRFKNYSGYKYAESLFENELFRIGGLKTFRGFEEETFFASAFSITSIEFRYLFEKNSAFYAFFDGGYYQKPEDTATFSDTPFGFGVGVDFETRAGIFTLNYALGRQQGNPVEFNSGKIYFGIINRF
ncbi:ShlB/FhaC/HecB family hemolysin secretion/activation protein [Bacteroidota bacterium]